MICLNFKGDPVEHLLVTLDGPHDRGAIQHRDTPVAPIVEGGPAELAEGPNGDGIRRYLILSRGRIMEQP